MKEISLNLNHLFGDIELNRWLFLFNSPYCKVMQRKDGSYYLTACRFEKLTGQDVAESARRLKIMMHAIAKIEHGVDFENQVPDDGEDTISYQELVDGRINTYVGLGKPASMGVGALVPKVETPDRCGRIVTKPRKERWFDYYLDRCDDWIDNTVMFKALSYFSQKTTAVALWWAYESIANDEGGFYKLVRNNDWVTEDELRFFTDSLNRYDIEGHGRHVEDPEDDYLRPKMSLPTAQTFLAERLLKPWLIKKAVLLGLAEGKAIAENLFHKLDIN
ncbi:MAG: hypothetical protein WAL97_07420 [Halobacteriota archaeon]